MYILRERMTQILPINYPQILEFFPQKLSIILPFTALIYPSGRTGLPEKVDDFFKELDTYFPKR